MPCLSCRCLCPGWWAHGLGLGCLLQIWPELTGGRKACAASCVCSQTACFPSAPVASSKTRLSSQIICGSRLPSVRCSGRNWSTESVGKAGRVAGPLRAVWVGPGRAVVQASRGGLASLGTVELLPKGGMQGSMAQERKEGARLLEGAVAQTPGLAGQPQEPPSFGQTPHFPTSEPPRVQSPPMKTLQFPQLTAEVQPDMTKTSLPEKAELIPSAEMFPAQRGPRTTHSLLHPGGCRPVLGR